MSLCSPYVLLPIMFSTFSLFGLLITPLSVMIAAIFDAGVTSKAGLNTFMSSGAILLPEILVTSSGPLSSMGISSPEAILKSNVHAGAAT